MRGMGVTLPIIIEEPSIIELWCGGEEAHPVFYTTLCILLFNVPIVSGTMTTSIVKLCQVSISFGNANYCVNNI